MGGLSLDNNGMKMNNQGVNYIRLMHPSQQAPPQQAQIPQLQFQQAPPQQYNMPPPGLPLLH